MPSLKILIHCHLLLQCSALIDETSKEDFVEEIKEEYEEIRDEHYDSLKVIVFLFTHVVDRICTTLNFVYMFVFYISIPNIPVLQCYVTD